MCFTLFHRESEQLVLLPNLLHKMLHVISNCFLSFVVSKTVDLFPGRRMNCCPFQASL